MIVMDTREPKALRFILASLLDAARPPIPYGSRALPAGDYELRLADGDGVLIERKEQKDLSASIIDGRFFRQLAKLHESASRCSVFLRLVLLVEGPPFPRSAPVWKADGGLAEAASRGIHPNALRGALLTAQQQGIYVLYSKGAEDTAKAILWLYQRFQRIGAKGVEIESHPTAHSGEATP